MVPAAERCCMVQTFSQLHTPLCSSWSNRISFDAKHPAIIPSKHHIVELVIRHYHEQEGHSGVSVVLSAIQQEFWITKGAHEPDGSSASVSIVVRNTCHPVNRKWCPADSTRNCSRTSFPIDRNRLFWSFNCEERTKPS